MKQTVISDFFRGTFKSAPTPNLQLSKKRKMSEPRRYDVDRFKNITYLETFIKVTTSLDRSELCVMRKPRKRKLFVPIFTDEEDDSEENEAENGLTGGWTPKKKPTKTPIRLNKPKSQSSTPETQSLSLRNMQTPIINHNKDSPKSSSSDVNSNPRSQSPGTRRASTKPLANPDMHSSIDDDAPSISQRQIPKKEDGKKVNYYYVEVLKKFYDNITSTNLHKLLFHYELDSLKRFFEMPLNYQYVCMKLFMWKHIWRNVFKFTEQLNLLMDPNLEVLPMFEFLVKQGFACDNYIHDDISVLLNQIGLKDLRYLAKDFKIVLKKSTKENLMNKLIEICRTQSSLSSVKSTEDVLRDRIRLIMGFCFKISDTLKESLFKIFLLNTFTNRNITRPEDFFAEEYLQNICYPTLQIEEYLIFYTADEFSKYSKAVLLSHDLEVALNAKKTESVFQICEEAFKRLKELSGQGLSSDPNRPKYLERYSAVSKYMSVLIEGGKYLTPSRTKDVRVWLEYLLTIDFCLWRRPKIYIQLSLIYSAHLKEHSESAKILVKAFKEEDLSERLRHELAHRSNMCRRKTYNVPRLYLDELLKAQPPSCERHYTEVVVTSQAIRTNEPGYKRKYVVVDEGSRLFLNVEEVALRYYNTNGYPRGIHCEGRLVLSLFNLLFWDLIYDFYVTGTFVSKFQTVPLDMYTKYFYTNREAAIKRRLEQIHITMTDEKLMRLLLKNFNLHSHESSLINVDGFMSDSNLTDPEQLFEMVLCMGRFVLSRICERLVGNLGEYSSGMPDLFVWDSINKKCKFVEVKGENDKLAINQKLWLNYLMDIGAEVEVCHVHSTGSKMKLKV